MLSGATGHCHVGVAVQDALGGADHGLQAGAAQEVQGQARRLDAATAFDGSHPAQVHVARLGVGDMAEDNVADLLAVDPGAGQRFAGDEGGEGSRRVSFRLPP